MSILSTSGQQRQIINALLAALHIPQSINVPYSLDPVRPWEVYADRFTPATLLQHFCQATGQDLAQCIKNGVGRDKPVDELTANDMRNIGGPLYRKLNGYDAGATLQSFLSKGAAPAPAPKSDLIYRPNIGLALKYLRECAELDLDTACKMLGTSGIHIKTTELHDIEKTGKITVYVGQNLNQFAPAYGYRSMTAQSLEVMRYEEIQSAKTYDSTLIGLALENLREKRRHPPTLENAAIIILGAGIPVNAAALKELEEGTSRANILWAPHIARVYGGRTIPQAQLEAMGRALLEARAAAAGVPDEPDPPPPPPGPQPLQQQSPVSPVDYRLVGIAMRHLRGGRQPGTVWRNCRNENIAITIAELEQLEKNTSPAGSRLAPELILRIANEVYNYSKSYGHAVTDIKELEQLGKELSERTEAQRPAPKPEHTDRASRVSRRKPTYLYQLIGTALQHLRLQNGLNDFDSAVEFLGGKELAIDADTLAALERGVDLSSQRRTMIIPVARAYGSSDTLEELERAGLEIVRLRGLEIEGKRVAAPPPKPDPRPDPEAGTKPDPKPERPKNLSEEQRLGIQALLKEACKQDGNSGAYERRFAKPIAMLNGTAPEGATLEEYVLTPFSLPNLQMLEYIGTAALNQDVAVASMFRITLEKVIGRTLRQGLLGR